MKYIFFFVFETGFSNHFWNIYFILLYQKYYFLFKILYENNAWSYPNCQKSHTKQSLIKPKFATAKDGLLENLMRCRVTSESVIPSSLAIWLMFLSRCSVSFSISSAFIHGKNLQNMFLICWALRYSNENSASILQKIQRIKILESRKFSIKIRTIGIWEIF